MDRFGLTRFVDAQDDRDTFARALGELRSGRKRTHWMWFVFPQIAGLGRSPAARKYALAGLEEAQAYLTHDVLGPRLRACLDALLDLGTSDPESVLGGIDALKLRSSLTLFLNAAPGDAQLQDVLNRFYGGEPDPATDELLGVR